jgi:hypothetical protein
VRNFSTCTHETLEFTAVSAMALKVGSTVYTNVQLFYLYENTVSDNAGKGLIILCSSHIPTIT